MLATKFYTPTRRPDVVVRRRLTARLDPTLEPGRRLTLVSAPAGFGKTTVLSEWIAHLEDHGGGAAVGWLSLDDSDNDPPRFLAHLVTALERTGIGLTRGVLDTTTGAVALDDLVGLVNAVSLAGDRAPGPPCVVVLDDYHVITSTQVHEAVTFLVDNLPECLRLVVATRADPPLPLSRLRARGQLLELRAADLRFTPPEAAEFLNRGMGLQLSVDHVAALDERTEGWVAGPQLAALCLRGVHDREEVESFIEVFAGSNRFVIDYLTDEVLARQSDELRQFLLRTSILDQLSGSLCDAVTAAHDGRLMLAELERANLFVVPLDAHRGLVPLPPPVRGCAQRTSARREPR